MRTAREMAIEWLYPGATAPNPAALRRDEQVSMLARRFKQAMADARADERIRVMDEFGILHGEDAKNLIKTLEDNSPSPALTRLLESDK